MKRYLLCLAAAFSLAYPASAQESTTRTLPGGATLVVLREPDAKQVVIDALFRVGVADENAVGDGGLTALLARTWAAGGEMRTANQIANDFGEFGAYRTLSTGEYIELTAFSDPGGIKEAATTLLMSVVAAPSFPDSAVIRAKRTVQRDRELREDDLLSDANFQLRSKIFPLAAEGRDPLGEPASAASASAQNLRRYFAKTVGIDGSRAVFVVAGNVDPDDAEDMVRSSLAAGNWGGLNMPNKRRPTPTVPTEERIPAGRKTIDLRRGSPGCYVITSFIAPGTSTAPKAWAALTVLDSVLAGGKDSRLFPLRDRPTGDSAPIGYDISGQLEPGRNNSLWTITVAGVTDVAGAKAQVQATTQALADGSRPVTPDELERAKAYLKGKHRRDRQRLADRASAAGLAELMGLGSGFETNYETVIDAVTLDDVNRAAKQIFGGNSLSLVVGTPPSS